MNENITAFSKEVSRIIGFPIGEDHIHCATKSREYYIPAPISGAPLLLHHYRGVFFIDLSPEDFRKIESGEISPSDYVRSANWQVGYYWGGGSMIGGGYFQPIDIVNHSEEVHRYLQVLHCRGARLSSGWTPTQEQCASCEVDNCPFSKYSPSHGKWEEESIQEDDPRGPFFDKLKCKFEKEYPGYSFRGACSSRIIKDDEILLSPNDRYTPSDNYTFEVYASENLIRALMMRTRDPLYGIDEFTFKVKKGFYGDILDATPETISGAFESSRKVNNSKPSKPSSKERNTFHS